MRNKIQGLLGAFVCGVMVLAGASSCEKMNVEGADGDGPQANVVMRIGSIEQIPFPVATRAAIEDLCSRLCFHVYDDDGVRVDYVNQNIDDEHFGTASFLLEEGHYYLVVVAHSGSKNPSFSANEKVTISGSELGDTFWCCKEFYVEEEVVNLELPLSRIVSMLQFIPTVTPPEGLNKILVKYKGSKGTFNGLTGYGSTNTNQTLDLYPSEDDRQYEFYMIPRAEEDELDISFKAYHVDDNDVIHPLGGCTIDAVPVKRNSITICRGNLFDESDRSASVIVNVSIDESWDENIVINI
jgi:hypothetical protein